MINATFIHIPNIGVATETALWREGCHTWHDALALSQLPLRRAKIDAGQFRAVLEESIERLAGGDAAWFGERLPPAEQWRLFDAFKHSTAYVDIETTGLSYPYDHITTVALYDGAHVRTFMHGDNLDDFVEALQAYSLLVSFNGRTFDAPFIERSFQCALTRAHLDLRPVLRTLGMKGGLKHIEQCCGMNRGDLNGVDGYTAVLLWRYWKRTGNRRALETLLSYNVEDVLSLEQLAIYSYNAKVKALSDVMKTSLIPEVPCGVNPWQAHPDILRML